MLSVILALFTPGRAEADTPAVLRDSLSNGLRITILRSTEVPIVDINILIRTGARMDPHGKDGTTALMTRLLLGGTQTRDAQEIVREMASLGSTVTPFVSHEYAQLYSRCLARNFRQTLDVLADVVRAPRFSRAEFERQARALRAGIPDGNYAPEERATRALISSIYGPDHALLREPYGTLRTVDSISLEDVQACYSTSVHPATIDIIVTGSVDVRTVQTLLRDRFGDWSRATSPGRSPASSTLPEGGCVIIEDTARTISPVRIGRRVPGPASAEFPALVLLDRLLGGGRDSRIFRTYWGEHLVHPSFQSGIVPSADGSLLVIFGNTPAARLDSLDVFLNQQFDRIAREGIPSAELSSAVRSLQLEATYDRLTSRRVQRLLQTAIITGGNPVEALEIGTRVAEVTDADLRALAGRLRDQPGWMTVVGASRLLRPFASRAFGDRISVEM